MWHGSEPTAVFERVDRFRAGWVAVGVLLAAVLGFILLGFLGTVVFGLFLYYATRPVYRRVRTHVDRQGLAAAVSLVTLAAPVVALVGYTVAVGLQEASSLLENANLGPYRSIVQPYLDVSAAVDQPGRLVEMVGDPGAVTEVLSSTVTVLSSVGSGLLYLFVAFAIAFYLLRDDHRLTGYLALLDDDSGVVTAYWRAVDDNLSEIFFGNILNALVTGAIGAIIFSLLNLAAPAAFDIPYPALLGLLAGAGSLIPVVGMKIVYVPLVLYLGGQAALTGGGWEFVALVAGVSVVVVDLVPDIVLRPYISGGDLHTGTVTFAYVLGPVVFGWYGLFLGPLLLVLATQFVRLVLPELLAGQPLAPDIVPPGDLATADEAREATDETPTDTSSTDAEDPEAADGDVVTADDEPTPE